jgi:two-component system chemotaxis response regulator CheB
MASSMTGRGTKTTIRALEIGAVDFFLKASIANPVGSCGCQNELITKIKLAAKVDKASLKRGPARQESPLRARRLIPRHTSSPRKVVVIASSTGGPGALYQIIPRLPEDLPAALIVIQHMPAGFTRSLSERLNELSLVSVREAEPDVLLKEGQVLMAPGSYHMMVEAGDKISINQNLPVLGLRPAADVTMPSVARWYEGSSIGVVLTGMGSDGTNGAASIKASGGKVVAQDEATCVVYGMPRSVVESGLADKIVPLSQIAEEIVALCQS